VKIAVLGASGLLGSAVSQSVVRRGHNVYPYSNASSTIHSGGKLCKVLSLENDEQLTRELFDQWPDAIVNCAAVSSPDSVNLFPAKAKLVNVDGAYRLATIASHIGARFIHISTDMVFDGKKSPYRSTDVPNPLSEYGKQKLEAEKKVLSVSEENIVVLRITLINGNSPSGKRSQHEKILRGLAEQKSLTFFDDEIRQPCSSENTADAVVELLERPQLNGLFHWAGTEEVSRYQLAIRILRHFGINSEKIIPGSVQTAKAEVGERPNHLSFILEPLSSKLCVQPLSIEEQIEQLKIPSDMYSWYRQFADSPSSYIHRF
jgi:dTDP-4-dehydrorhamnose reductase